MPEVSGNKLSIAPKKGAENQFELDANGFKDVEVTLNNSINNNGIKMHSNYGWTYRVSNATDEQTLVNFAVDSKCGEMTPSGKASYNVGSEIKIKFTESELFEFIDLEIVSEDGLSVYADVTGRTYDKQSGISEAVITVLEGNGNLTIKPVCAPRPVVESFAPAYIAAGTNFDSSIVLSFGAEISKESFVYSNDEFASLGETATAVRANPNDENSDIVAVDVAGKRYFKNLTITDEENENVAIHYRKSELSEDCKKLTVYFDGSRLFDFDGKASKDIYVTVSPEVHSLYTKADGTKEKILLSDKGKSQDCNFRVRNSSESKAKVTFSAYDGSTSMGTMNYSGEKEFNLGETFTVNFESNEAYGFVKWVVSGNEEGNLILSENGTLLTCTVAGGCEGITITPFCEKLNLSTIFFETTSGSVSPSGFVDYRRNAKIQLVSTISSDYCFIKWKVKNTLTNEIYSEEKAAQYFKFENLNAAITTATVLQDSANLSIVATAEAKPRVYATTPNGLSNQVDRDSNIRVFMNKGLSEKSLYYSDDEAKAFEAKGYKVLYENESDKKNPYGYYSLESDLSSYVFKNIKITDNSDGTNYLKYYGCPYLGDSTGKVLIIPVKKLPKSNVDSTPDPDKNLPGNREILVEIGTEYGFYSDDVLVNLENVNLIWAYKTNGNFDTTKPTIVSSSTSIKGTNTSGGCTYTSGNSIPSSLASNKSWYQTRLVKKSDNGTVPVTLKVTANDENSNLQSVTLVAQKVVDSDYNEINTDNPTSKYTLPIVISGQNGTFNGTINLIDKNTLGLDEGLYKVYFELIDQVGNKTVTDSSHYYYLLIDYTPPKDAGNLKFYINNGKVQVLNLRKNFNTDKDYESHSVTLGGTGKTYTDDNTFTSLTNGVDVPLVITTNDIFGNTTEYTYQLNAGAKPGMYMYEDGTFSIDYYSEKSAYGIVVSSDFTNIKVVTKPVYIAADCKTHYSWSLGNVINNNTNAETTLNGKTTLDLPTINELYKIYEYREKLSKCGGADFLVNSDENFNYTFNDGTVRSFGVRSSITMHNGYLSYGYDSFSGTFYYSKDRGRSENDTYGEGYILFNSSTGSHIYKKTYDGKNLFYTHSSALYNDSMYGIFNVKLIASYTDSQ